jgi:hypothetical protein
MKKLSILAAAAALICGSLLATTRQVGLPVSDNVSATLKGGCPGHHDLKCVGGTCPSSDAVESGSQTGYVKDTAVHCGGADSNTSCDTCATDGSGTCT